HYTTPAPPELFTLSLHDALPISGFGLPCLQRRQSAAPDSIQLLDLPRLHGMAGVLGGRDGRPAASCYRTADRSGRGARTAAPIADRKSTRLNSSHVSISYAVFCL